MLISILNVILCCAVLVMVIAPLVWAILTQHRDRPAAGEPAAAAVAPPQWGATSFWRRATRPAGAG